MNDTNGSMFPSLLQHNSNYLSEKQRPRLNRTIQGIGNLKKTESNTLHTEKQRYHWMIQVSTLRTSQSQLDEKLTSEMFFVQITTKARKKDTKFDILRQRVPKGHTSEGYACFKQWTKSCVT